MLNQYDVIALALLMPTVQSLPAGTIGAFLLLIVTKVWPTS